MRAFTRQEIDESDGTTLTGSLPSDNYFLPSRGYETRVEGYGAPQERDDQAMTQPVRISSYSQPLPVVKDDVKKVVNLKPLGHQDHPPKPNEKTGGVEFLWTGAEEAEESMEFVPASNLQLEGEEVARLELELQGELETLLAKADGLSQRRTDYLHRKESAQLAEGREGLLHAVVESGSWLPLIMSEQEHFRLLQLSAMDIAACSFKDGWARGWEFCKGASAPARVEVDETARLMEGVSLLLDRVGSELAKAGDSDKVEELRQRHQVLESGLSGRHVSRQVAALFPQSGAQAILDWYARLRIGLEEVDRLRTLSWDSACMVSGLLDQYPGPRLRLSQGKSSTSGAAGLRESGGSTLGMELHRPEADAGLRMGEGSTQGLESYRSDFRVQAQSAGRGYRMGGGTPVQEPQPLGYQVQEAVDLPSHLIRSQGGPRARVEERSVARSGGSVQSGVSGYDEDSGVTGFGGEGIESILEEVLVYVCDTLSALGKDTPVTVAIIMDCMPMLNLWTKSQSSTTKDFTRAVKDIKPRTTDNYVSVREWWKAINVLADDYGWALRTRIAFMRRTGGLAPKHNDTIARRVRDLMEHPKDWVRSVSVYDANKPEANQRYWLYIWIDVGLKLIAEFHQIQPVDEIEKQLGELMDEEPYQIDQTADDPLNSQLYKIQLLYKAMNTWLRDRSSALVDSPLYVWKLLVEWLKASKPAGPLMLTHINKALNLLSTNVEGAIPLGHNCSKAKLEAIRRQGVMGATEDTFGMVLERLKLRAVNGELTMEVRTFSQMKELQDQAQGDGETSLSARDGKKRRPIAKVQSVTTDYRPNSSVSTMTLNTTATGGARFPMCPTCRLFHPAGALDSAGKPVCLFFDPVKRTFKTKAFLAHRNVMVMNRKGERAVSEYWLKKLEQFTFPAIDVNSKDKAKILKDLRDAVASMPKAQPNEIKRYADEAKRFVAMVECEETSHIGMLRKEVSTLVNMAATLTATKASSNRSAAAKQRAKKERRKVRKAEKKEDSESSSASESDSEDESDSDFE